jgi:hypothetical protein
MPQDSISSSTKSNQEQQLLKELPKGEEELPPAPDPEENQALLNPITWKQYNDSTFPLSKAKALVYKDNLETQSALILSKLEEFCENSEKQPKASQDIIPKEQWLYNGKPQVFTLVIDFRKQKLYKGQQLCYLEENDGLEKLMEPSYSCLDLQSSTIEEQRAFLDGLFYIPPMKNYGVTSVFERVVSMDSILFLGLNMRRRLSDAFKDKLLLSLKIDAFCLHCNVKALETSYGFYIAHSGDKELQKTFMPTPLLVWKSWTHFIFLIMRLTNVNSPDFLKFA